jgi:hypothetical protein
VVVIKPNEALVVNHWKLAIALLTCFSAFHSLTSRADELVDRATTKSEVAQAFKNEDFKRLEKLSSQYRKTEVRTSSGLWKLTLFYTGLSDALDTHQRDNPFWMTMNKSAEAWVKRYPNSPSARLGYAQMLLNRGWSYRGSGYADTVAEKDWKPFREYTQKAREYLEKTRKISEHDPRWYELMIRIATYQGWPQEEFDVILNEGMSRYPNFYQLHFAAIDYLTPKWGGDAAAIEQFAREALRLTRKTEGTGMYARIYWYASQTQYGNELFTRSKVDWSLMKQGIDDVLAKYPDAWNVNNFARFACMKDDKKKTSELIDRIGPEPLMQVWQTQRTYDYCAGLGKS